jgi:hypothetical protein
LWRGWLKIFQNNSQGGGGLVAVGRVALCLDWFTLLRRGDYDYDYDYDITNTIIISIHGIVIVIVIVIPVGITIVIVNIMVIVIAIVLVTVIAIVIAAHTQGQTDPPKQCSHPVGSCLKKL